MADRNSFGERALKKIPLHDLEAAIADAVSELAGERFTVSIARFDAEASGNAAVLDSYEVTVRIARELSGSIFGTDAETSSTAEAPAADTQATSDEEARIIDRTVTGLTGRRLNDEWEVGARHALYHHEGRWYHQLRRFPGALFDYSGYVLFNSREDFTKCPHLAITQDVYVPKAIQNIPGYVRRR